MRQCINRRSAALQLAEERDGKHWEMKWQTKDTYMTVKEMGNRM
jgi:hypothetical protein